MHVTIKVISLKSLNNAVVLSLALLDLLEMSYGSLIERICCLETYLCYIYLSNYLSSVCLSVYSVSFLTGCLTNSIFLMCLHY